jgi:ATP-dependent DNA helicase RecG
MTSEKIEELLQQGGHLLLGVKDSEEVEGVIESCIPEMVNNLITTANNPAKLNPPLYCSPQVLEYEGKKIIYLYVPESAHVHSTNGKVFDRSGDSDLDITRQSWAVENLYMRKQGSRYENRVFPYFELADCNKRLFKRIRQMAGFRVDKHPWEKMRRSSARFLITKQTPCYGWKTWIAMTTGTIFERI